MNIDANDDTMKEILMDDEELVLNGGKKKRGCFFRSLVVLIVLLAGLLGFIFFQQYLLDLEAEAIVSAARTATALVMPVESKGVEPPGVELPADPIATKTPLPAPTATEDPAFKRTATVEMQLTDVAAFQLTATSQP
jgi:hypothetical protein